MNTGNIENKLFTIIASALLLLSLVSVLETQTVKVEKTTSFQNYTNNSSYLNNNMLKEPIQQVIIVGKKLS